jgi:lipid-binding SYLF domain-containing protein
MGGAAVCYSYSCSKGMFAGVSIEGSLLTTRNDINHDFYGAPAQAEQIMLCA